MSNSEIKALAKVKIKGNIGVIWKGVGILFFIQFGFNMLAGNSVDIDSILSRSSMFTAILFMFVISPLQYGTTDYLVDFSNNGVSSTKQLFVHYKDIVKIFVIVVMTQIIANLGLLLFIVPGIMAVTTFSIIPYMYRENRDLDIFKLLSLSWKMMKGHKMSAFLFELSFILWLLLVIFSFGLAIIWIGPYMDVSLAIFYNQIKEEYYASNVL